MTQVDFDDLQRTAAERIARASDEEGLRAIEREYLDKGGVIAGLLASIPTLEPTERREFGQSANGLKQAVQAALADGRAALAAGRLAAELAADDFDPTLPGARLERGSLHPLTQVRREVEDLFSSMGYQVLDGPEVELDYYNFQALNIPVDHPSREEQDTFYCDREHTLVMRTQTSPVQIRAMERMTPPFRVIAPGRVFRNEQQDATHEHTFHQVEGLVVGHGVQVGHLTWTLKNFLTQLFDREVPVRLRPGFFPFVEPGFEFDMGCAFCGGKGCRVCKGSGWIEFCGCGMVHPRVLEAGFAGRDDVDVSALTGFAFGFGLDRLVMTRYGVDDIRQFMGGDLRFLEQF
ncbi:phenylalanine--tRNA ligase subunit alpha [Engelhardtia mirabilis]|uniref:Phenylalanine--tRNA ligase alpha subunit n=1 Tax=Engelhardtia mirabilis TaxID=2528011 RepID=A0A518BK51_9BACT|nr:Phenylalanine--tRNA ligase alpha subunit [Planctomycetes bacterium Pla133]QDV01683.1 Phenylalanine--tRNA ligase alpha subunit [Planctomycetes bacterium Pla86]